MPQATDPAPLILASGSPRRRDLLGELGVAFEVRVADVDESLLSSEAPEPYARRLALAKARAVAAGAERGLVLGADTIVVLGADVLGKPTDPTEARSLLRRLRGRRHVVITALALVDAKSGAARVAAEHSGVWLRDLADAEIDAYVATGDPLDKAGGYAVQHAGFRPVARIEGSETNVIGLPLTRLAWMLAAAATGTGRAR